MYRTEGFYQSKDVKIHKIAIGGMRKKYGSAGDPPKYLIIGATIESGLQLEIEKMYEGYRRGMTGKRKAAPAFLVISTGRELQKCCTDFR